MQSARKRNNRAPLREMNGSNECDTTIMRVCINYLTSVILHSQSLELNFNLSPAIRAEIYIMFGGGGPARMHTFAGCSATRSFAFNDYFMNINGSHIILVLDSDQANLIAN